MDGSALAAVKRPSLSDKSPRATYASESVSISEGYDIEIPGSRLCRAPE
jgi:hypothetical protein